MMKNLKKFKVLSFLILFAILILINSNCVFAADLGVNVNFDGNKIEMTSETPNMEWSVENLLPGESKSSNVVITNKGKNDTKVNFTINIEDGKDLAEILNIKIIKVDTNGEKEVFNGKYNKLSAVDVDLKKDSKQTFKIVVSMPEEAGNEFQNKECKLKFKFVASGENSGKPVVTEVVKPAQTGESKAIFVFIGLGILAVALLVVTFVKGKGKNKDTNTDKK